MFTFPPLREILLSESIWLAKFLTSSQIYPRWARLFSLFCFLFTKISSTASSQAARRTIYYTRLYFPSLAFPESYSLSLSLSFFSCGKDDAIAETNKSIERVVPRTSAKSVCGARENARRGTAGKNRGPVKFPGKVVPRLRWPINMGKRRYTRSAATEGFYDSTWFSPLSWPPSFFRSIALRNSRQFVAFRACEK